MNNSLRVAGVIAVLAILLPSVASARIGVGVGTGKITLNEALKPGSSVSLPPLVVLNTGTEAAEYGISTEYHQDQPQMRPGAEWFSFNPEVFRLEPGKSQSVEIRLNLPVKAAPGSYFAYLEAHPVVKNTPGTSVGVAAASKLNFSVAPANILAGLYYKAGSWLAAYSPWPYVVLAVIAASVLVIVLRRYVSINIGVAKKQ